MNAIDLVSSEQLLRLLDAPCESETLDFKRQLRLGTKRADLEFAKDVLAFANSGGGHIIVGVADGSRDLVGLDNHDEQFLRDSKSANDRISKYTGGNVRVLLARHTVDWRGKTATAAIIFIPGVEDKIPAALDGDYTEPGLSGKPLWVFRRGDVYVRKGDESVKVETPDDLKNRAPHYAVTLPNDQSEADKGFSNPYDFATAASREMFKGRSREIEELLDNVESGTHTAVFGLQRIGKTSLVEEALTLKIEDRTRLRGQLGFAKLDFQRIGTDSTNYKGVLHSIVRTVAEAAGAQDLQAVEDSIALVIRGLERGSNRLRKS